MRFQYADLAEQMLSKSRGVPVTGTWHPITYATTARFVNDDDDLPSIIVIELHGKIIARLFDNGDVEVDSCGFRTVTTQRRLNAVLKPIGHVVTSKRGTWKVLDTAQQTVRDFRDGMIVRPSLTVSTNRQERKA